MMPNSNFTGERELEFLARLSRPTGRRQFLQWAGVTVAVTAVGCSDRDNPLTGVGNPDDAHLTPPEDPGETVSLGMGDFAVLNYAFALEQLEAEFYTQVVDGSYFAGATAEEQQVMIDLKAHEIIHREFLYQALDANGANIPGLRFDFTSVDFSSRESVLGTAQVLEDTGVSAYNGAAQLLQSAAFIGVAGKIVSVEARHASRIRSLLQPGTAFFAGDDIINTQGLDLVRVPAMVLEVAGGFIETPLDASGVPEPQYVPASPTATV